MKLAQNKVDEIFGKISPPPGSKGLNAVDPATGLSNLLIVALRLVFFFAGVILLVYLLWGAFDWLMSEGDKEKLGRAQGKITQAVVGIFIMVAVLTIFSVITGNVLGIIDISGGGLKFQIPHL